MVVTKRNHCFDYLITFWKSALKLHGRRFCFRVSNVCHFAAPICSMIYGFICPTVQKWNKWCKSNMLLAIYFVPFVPLLMLPLHNRKLFWRETVELIYLWWLVAVSQAANLPRQPPHAAFSHPLTESIQCRAKKQVFDPSHRKAL